MKEEKKEKNDLLTAALVADSLAAGNKVLTNLLTYKAVFIKHTKWLKC